MSIKKIENQDDFEKALKEAEDKLVVVDFFATWCGPCKMIAPKLEAWSNELTNCVFLKVDVDDAEDVATKYEISAMPTFLFFKNEKKVDSIVGANEAKLKETIDKLK